MPDLPRRRCVVRVLPDLVPDVLRKVTSGVASATRRRLSLRAFAGVVASVGIVEVEKHDTCC